MHNFDIEFHRRLLQEIAELRLDKQRELSLGAFAATAVDTNRIGGEYLRRIGYLNALDHMEELCRKVDEDMSKQRD